MEHKYGSKENVKITMYKQKTRWTVIQEIIKNHKFKLFREIRGRQRQFIEACYDE